MARAEVPPHERAVRSVMEAWEDSPAGMRLTVPEQREAAELAIAALRCEGWSRA